MLRDSSLRKVACETQDDVVLTWATSPNITVEEFVQVKSDRQKRQWSVSMFCEQEKETPLKDEKKVPIRYRKDTSIFEKNALRDQGKRISRFRMVTHADVNELRELTKPSTNRVAKETDELAKKLEVQLDGNTTLNLANIKYWVSAAIWDVRGTDSAVFDENFRKLAEAIQAQEQRLLSVVDLERILHHLAEETRAMAMGKGRCGANPNAVTAEELQIWLAAEVQAISHFLGEVEINALMREERNSLARCQTMWIALGVSPEDATRLAHQPEIGARAEFFAGFKPGFHWVTAGYGAGKSLAVERLYQHQVANYAAKRDKRVPIFLRAPSISGALQDAVLARSRELHRTAGTPSLFVVLDAVDEAGLSRAHQFLQEAYELSVTWPDSICIATSVNLPFAFEHFRRPLPNLSDDQAEEIVSQFAQYKVHWWQVRDRLSNDNGLALMCVLLGQALRETSDTLPSRGQLLHHVVEAARKRSGTDAKHWAEHGDLLCRIAMLSTDIGGGPVAPSKLGMTSIEMVVLATSKLVVEEAGSLVFTVTTMRLWFAAQALRKGLVDVAKLMADLPRVRHWMTPLAIFIATTDFDSAAHYIEPLASTYPAIAVQVIANSTRQWGEGSGRSPSEFDAFAKRIHRCLEAWLRGISPLANVCSFTDQKGALLKLKAGNGSSQTVIVFSNDQTLPPASALLSDWRIEDANNLYFHMESDEPSHIWRQTSSMVISDFLKFVERHRWELADPSLFHEHVWKLATDFTISSRLFASSIQWDTIDAFESDFRRFGVWDWLCEKRAAYPQAFLSPHPPADIENPANSWVASYYSPSAALARVQSVYSMAFEAYQSIVIKYFPNFRHDFPYSRWWPCRLVGQVGSFNDASPHWWINYYCEPVESEDATGVIFNLGTDPNEIMRVNLNKVRQDVTRSRPNSVAGLWTHSSILDLHHIHPATALVKEWLLNDLRSAGWNS